LLKPNIEILLNANVCNFFAWVQFWSLFMLSGLRSNFTVSKIKLDYELVREVLFLKIMFSKSNTILYLNSLWNPNRNDKLFHHCLSFQICIKNANSKMFSVFYRRFITLINGILFDFFSYTNSCRQELLRKIIRTSITIHVSQEKNWQFVFLS